MILESRTYKTFLTFNNNTNPLDEKYSAVWRCIANGSNLATSNINKYISNSNESVIKKRNRRSIKFIKEGAGLKCETNLNLSANKEYTLAFYFRINRHTLVLNQVFRPDIFHKNYEALKWNGGSGNNVLKIVYTYDPSSLTYFTNVGIGFDIGKSNTSFHVPFDYGSYTGKNFLHFLMSYDTTKTLRVFVDGIKYYDGYQPDIGYKFNNMILGDITAMMESSEPKLEFDEFCICDRCLFTDDYDVLPYPLDERFPYVEEKEVRDFEKAKKDEYTANPPFYYGRTKTILDGVNDITPIIRRKAYTPPHNYITDEFSKFKYDQRDLDDIAASNFSLKNDIREDPVIILT